MEKSTIILVGNGPSLLDNKNGSKIDSFDTVLRFNLYNTDKHSEYTGVKTNIWFTVSNVRITKRKVDEVYFHCWYKDKETHPYYLKLQEYFDNTKVISEDLLTEMRRHFDTKYGMFSTGMIAIYVMLKQYKQITLTGFDWWNKEYKLLNIGGEPRYNVEFPKQYILKLVKRHKNILHKYIDNANLQRKV